MKTRRQFLKGFGAVFVIPAAICAASSPDYRVTLPKPVKAKRKPLDYDAMLWAIAEKETGNRDNRIGRSGERSRYQIKEVVWKQHRPKSPFYLCRGKNATSVACEHIAWLEEHGAPKNVPDPEWHIAALWNYGISASFNPKWVNIILSDYADHVSNLYHDRLNHTNV